MSFKEALLMRTSLDIPGPLLEEAKHVVGVKTKTQAIVLALTELIQRRKSRKVLELKGSLSGSYDYKAFRKKR